MMVIGSRGLEGIEIKTVYTFSHGERIIESRTESFVNYIHV